MTADLKPIVVERFDINDEPTHGRPCIAMFTGRAGQLAVHCDRDDGTLWLFAHGPAGGNRGRLALGLQRAGEVLAWLDDPTTLLSGVHAWMTLRDGKLYVRRNGSTVAWQMPFDPAGLAEFEGCLREWAAAVERKRARLALAKIATAFLPDGWTVERLDGFGAGVTRVRAGVADVSVECLRRRFVVRDAAAERVTDAESWGLADEAPRVNLGPTQGQASPEHARGQAVAVLLAALDAEDRTITDRDGGTA